MNVETGTEAALFQEKEYINGIFLAVHRRGGLASVPLLVQVQFSHVTTCHSPAMSRRPAAATAAGAGSSPAALPRSLAAARSGAHLHVAARGSPHVRRKFAVNSTLNGGNNNVSDYQVERCCFVFFAKWFSTTCFLNALFYLFLPRVFCNVLFHVFFTLSWFS